MSGIRISLCIRRPPHSKKSGSSQAWMPVANRIGEAIRARGISVPYGGDVELILDIEDHPGADIDNRLLGVFSIMDGATAPGLRPLRDDGQIKRVTVARRQWLPDEDDVSIKVTL